MADRHAFFFGLDPTHPLHPSHEQWLGKRIKGSYRVICGHCGVSLMGKVEDPPGFVTEIIWTHDGSNWFGKFELATTV